MANRLIIFLLGLSLYACGPSRNAPNVFFDFSGEWVGLSDQNEVVEFEVNLSNFVIQYEFVLMDDGTPLTIRVRNENGIAPIIDGTFSIENPDHAIIGTFSTETSSTGIISITDGNNTLTSNYSASKR